MKTRDEVYEQINGARGPHDELRVLADILLDIRDILQGSNEPSVDQVLRSVLDTPPKKPKKDRTAPPARAGNS